MKLKLSTLFLGAAAMLSSCGAPQDVKSEKSEMRAPAYPLVMIDPSPVPGRLRIICMTDR